MSKLSIVTGLLLLVGFFGVTETASAQTRDSLKTDFGVELLGKGGIYSFSYQRMLDSRFAVHASLEALGGSEALIVAVPVGVTAYLVNKDGSPFVTGGASFLSGGLDLGDIESTVYGFTGLGFEYRAQSGFVFRGTAYALIYSGEFLIWPGLMVGYAF